MQNFLRTVSEFFKQHPINLLKNLAATKVACGIFVPQPDSVGVAKNLITGGGGINTRLVVGFDDAVLNENFGVPVYSLDELKTLPKLPVVMIIVGADNVGWPTGFAEYFRRLNMTPIILTNPEFVDNIAKFFTMNVDKLYKLYSSFKQEDSKKAFLGSLLGVVTRQVNGFHFATEPQYMLRGFMPEAGNIVIDGGAFNGDTGKDFALLGAKVYSFEMNEDNFIKCKEVAEKYNFTAEQYGLWSKPQNLSYTKNSSGSHVNFQGDSEAKFIDIDTYLEKNNIPRLDYLKFDIEGSELEALKGAANSIRKWKPKMAICVYHKMDDYFTIPEYVLSIRSDYEFEFRHYPSGISFTIPQQARELLEKYDIEIMPSTLERVLYCR